MIRKHTIQVLSTPLGPFQELAFSEVDLPGVTSSGWGHIVHWGVSFYFCLAFLHVYKFFSLTSSRQLLLISYFSSPFSGLNFFFLVFLIDFFIINVCSYHLSHLLFHICIRSSRYHQYNRYGYLMRENMLCAGEEGKDSCSGKLHSLFKEKREAGAKCEHVKIFRYTRNSWKVFVQSQKKVIWAHFSSS